MADRLILRRKIRNMAANEVLKVLQAGTTLIVWLRSKRDRTPFEQSLLNQLQTTKRALEKQKAKLIQEVIAKMG